MESEHSSDRPPRHPLVLQGMSSGKLLHAMQFPMNPASKPDARQTLTGARLCKHADYQRAYAAARKFQSQSMSWFLAPQPAANDAHPAPTAPRVGLTVPKVLGKAHDRNRIKRRMREVLRRHADLLPQGCDLILHPRRSVLTVEFARLEAETVRVLRQAGTEAKRAAGAAEPVS